MNTVSIESVSFRHRDAFGRDLGGGVQDISFDLMEGRVLSLLGPNGSGKSTVIKLLMGFALPSKGKIRRPKHFCFSYIGDGGRNLYSHLTISENIEFIRALKDLPRDCEAKRTEASLRSELGMAGRNMAISHMSRGMRQKASIICALALPHDFLLADEPTLGLDEPSQEAFENLLRCERQAGKGICLSTNDLQLAGRVSDVAVCLEKGRMKWGGSLEADSLRNGYDA